MNLTTNIDGYKLVDIKFYHTALERLEMVSVSIKPLRESLIHDIEKLNQLDKNTFAKSIRLLDRFVKEVNIICQIQV